MKAFLKNYNGVQRMYTSCLFFQNTESQLQVKKNKRRQQLFIFCTWNLSMSYNRLKTSMCHSVKIREMNISYNDLSVSFIEKCMVYMNFYCNL